MPSYRLSLRNTRMQDVIDDIGSGGFLKIGTTGMAVILAEIPLADPPFTLDDTTATINLAGTPRIDIDADNSGEAAAAVFTRSDGTIVASGYTVGGADDVPAPHFVIEDRNVVAGSEVKCVAGSIRHAG